MDLGELSGWLWNIHDLLNMGCCMLPNLIHLVIKCGLSCKFGAELTKIVYGI